MPTIISGDGTITGLTATGISAVQNLPAGSVLQVVQSVKTDTASTSSASWSDITGMSVSITPASSSNKILVFADINFGTNDNSCFLFFKLVRGSTDIYVGDAAGSRTRITTGSASSGVSNTSHCGINYLDSPATTSSTTYKIQWYNQNPSFTSYLNRSFGDANDPALSRNPSSITVMEIAA
jgi:hypothetical protein